MPELVVELTSDPQRMDITLIHAFLSSTYWADGRTVDQVQRSIENSRPYGLFVNGKQVAFARVLSDLVSFAYVMDVFVVPGYRGMGYAKRLLAHMIADPVFDDVTLWQLKTTDTHGLYAKFGFLPLTDSTNHMRLHREIREGSNPAPSSERDNL